MKGETATLLLVNLAGIMERADESLLPGVYKEVGAALHTDPTGLGSLTLFRSIVQSSCYPIAAYLAVRHNRAHVIALGAFLWAAATFLVAFSSTFFQVALSRAFNGIGLALVAPAIQSLVADSTDDSNRGMAFGWLQLTGNVGSIIGGLFSVLIAPITVFGIPGWRISFHIVGLISIIVGVLVYLFANDPHFSDNGRNDRRQAPNKTFWSEVKDLVEESKSVLKISSFQIIVAQGVTGSFPCSIGGLFGGKMGDILSKHLPNSGRIILAQISSGSAIPLAALLLLGLPDDPSSIASHALVLIIMGLLISWNAPATNNPIFAEIVPERSRTSVYALDRSFESILSSFAPPAVGILAQHVYGYKPLPEGSSESQEISTDRENAASLAKSLYTAIGIPMALCCIIYTFLYRTYPRDRERAKMKALIESEMQLIESGALDMDKEFESEELSIAEFEYDGDGDLDGEDNTLLYRQLTFSKE
ncbi:uncharacterized protein LOC106764092 isoform X2 [Vigna radiata var. radiata]|uniref:Uncharacterized protein LOC106764092 isoform X2 n=1 Tax=Vigna radiata var. radiata TaxID=3916 RepID=A0A3Q0F5F1_VIGRR|nr:uncharacterized protein LOC106764092 isoform X2 [Vigna radiata var. radiata]